MSHSNIIGHIGDESFQAIDCAGTDNQTTVKYGNTQKR